ncbi:hypothetical protein SLA2020_235160 [Shorea laevis]
MRSTAPSLVEKNCKSLKTEAPDASEYHTFETFEYQISLSGVHGVAKIGSNHHGITVCSALDTYFGTSFWDSSDLRDNGTSKQCVFYNGGICSGIDYLHYGEQYLDGGWYVDRPLLLRD